MPVISNTFRSTSAVGNRESLSDVVSRITPEDTPIFSMISKGSTKSVHPEWETEELAAPVENIIEEGDEFDFDAVSPPSRMGNYTQIMRKSWIISGTQEETDEAGNIQKMKHQKLKKGTELRKDIELSLVVNNASVGGAVRESGSLSSWIKTNVERNGGSNGGFNSGTGLTVAETPGTQRAFTKTLLDANMQACYKSGANVNHCVVSPYLKSVFVTFMSDTNVASFRYAASDGKNNSIVANADVYEGPFGKVLIHPNRVMTTAATARRAFLIDTEMLEWLWFRNIHNVKDLAKTGDAHKGVILGEGCLKVKNEAGLGMIADLYGMTSGS